MNYDLQLAPGQTKPINVQGNYFCIVFSPVDLLVRIPGTEKDVYSQGDSLELPPGEKFARLEITNPHLTATATILIYAGFGRYVQRRQAVVEPHTDILAWAGTSIGPASGQTFLGLPTGNKFRRKCIQVTNEDPNNSLQIRDEAGNVALTIFHETSVTLPISGFVQVYNPLGVAIACRVSEIFWTS